jgi:hypothetical protein
MAAQRRSSTSPAKAKVRAGHWLARLEKEIRQRTGWVDACISPFARMPRGQAARPQVRRAGNRS